MRLLHNFFDETNKHIEQRSRKGNDTAAVWHIDSWDWAGGVARERVSQIDRLNEFCEQQRFAKNKNNKKHSTLTRSSDVPPPQLDEIDGCELDGQHIGGNVVMYER